MADKVNLTHGSDDWHKLRDLATTTIPGKRSALYFLNAKIRGLEPLVPMTYRAHLGMCLFAESATGIPEIDECRIKLILVPRGVGKSSLITKGLPLLNIIRDREHSTLIANETATRAESFLDDIKNEFESNELFRALFPETIPDDFRATTWRADRIIVNRTMKNPTSPSVLAMGVGGAAAGIHMNDAVVDDLIGENAAEAARRGNFEEIEKSNRWLARLQPLLKNPRRDEIYVIGTRWWEGDSYDFVEEFWGKGEARTEFKWTLNLPAQKFQWAEGEVNRQKETQHIKLYKRGDVAVFKFPVLDENGRSIFPERYTEDEIAEMMEQDPVFAAGQYFLEPTAGAASTFYREWLKDFTIEGSHIRYFNDEIARFESVPLATLTTFISVDPAFSKKSSAARTAIPVIGTDGRRLFLLEDFAERLDSEDEIAAKVLDFWKRYNPQKIFVETIVAQTAVANAIRRRFRDERIPEPSMEEIKSHSVSNKKMRIYGLEHYFKRGLFFIQKHQTRFVQEYVSFPRAVLRDLLDAISFQKDEWEKVFKLTHRTSVMGEATQEAQREAEERVRRAWSTGRRRGRRRR